LCTGVKRGGRDELVSAACWHFMRKYKKTPRNSEAFSLVQRARSDDAAVWRGSGEAVKPVARFA